MAEHLTCEAKGKFGSVHKCMEKATGKTFALKRFRTVRLPRHNGDLMEVAVLKAIGKHPQIAYLHAMYEYKGYCTLVTELVLGGALFDRIQQEDTLDEAVTVCIIRQVLLGLCHLKKCQVLHCDLKPENLVMVEPRGYRLKIIDFGLACFYDPKMRRRPAGTLTYLAPETQNYDPQSYSTDLWSVAVIAYEILSGITPFEIPQDGDLTRKLSDAEISLNITQVRYNFEDEGIVDASAEAKDFIKKILVRNPIRRPAVEECLVHPWIKMPDIKRSKVMRSVSLFRQGSQRVLQRGDDYLYSKNETDIENRSELMTILSNLTNSYQCLCARDLN
ncbi:unnamed protein product [Calicophoron daubneyi]|uniref:Protein kinase domain-containing protein n=1 Tax=Calicophoron daubneyi TaxID=300641 RepID=A0AAV2TV58_CALDB